MLGFRSNRIIRIHFRVSYYPCLIDNEPARHGQGPGIISVVFGHINPKLKIKRFQIFRQCKYKTVFFGDLISRIAKQVKGQIFLLDQFTVELRQLRRDGQKICPERLNFTGNLLKSIQLQIAIGSPFSPIKTEHQRAGGKKIF